MRYSYLEATHKLKLRHPFSGSGLTAAACQSKLALVVSMRIRNTGESLSRPFPRLQRTRRCRGRTSHSDLKRRTSKCTPSPYRVASGLPPHLPAATLVSDAPPCTRWPPHYIHRHRYTFGTISTPSVAPSLHVTTTSLCLRRGLPTATSATAAAAVRRSQAQSPRRPPARPSPNARAAAQPVCSGIRKRLLTTRTSGLLPPVPATTSSSGSTPIVPASHPPSSPPQPTPQ